MRVLAQVAVGVDVPSQRVDWSFVRVRTAVTQSSRQVGALLFRFVVCLESADPPLV